jgi:predicted naringenin-chalcone synthase
MGLSPRVPEVLSQHVAPLVRSLLDRHDVRPSDVHDWAIHPGGPRILDVVQDELGLAPDALDVSRACLAAHGNCSSPTVLMILADLLRATDRTGPTVLMAFGPGLTLYAGLLSSGA